MFIVEKIRKNILNDRYSGNLNFFESFGNFDIDVKPIFDFGLNHIIDLNISFKLYLETCVLFHELDLTNKNYLRNVITERGEKFLPLNYYINAGNYLIIIGRNFIIKNVGTMYKFTEFIIEKLEELTNKFNYDLIISKTRIENEILDIMQNFK